jgi:hypothetical protein
LDFVCKRLEGAALVGGSSRPVFLKLNDWLETEDNGSNLWLEDPNKVGSGGFCEVNDDQLWSDKGIGLLTNLFGERGTGEMFF